MPRPYAALCLRCFFLFCLSLVPLILPMSMLVALAMSAPKLAVSNTP